jgi:predicted RNase H-like nuclease (RuvC/YqgF family)
MRANDFIEREKAKGLHVTVEVPTPRLVYVIGVDPGTKTGFAVYDKEG